MGLLGNDIALIIYILRYCVKPIELRLRPCAFPQEDAIIPWINNVQWGINKMRAWRFAVKYSMTQKLQLSPGNPWNRWSVYSTSCVLAWFVASYVFSRRTIMFSLRVSSPKVFCYLPRNYTLSDGFPDWRLMLETPLFRKKFTKSLTRFWPRNEYSVFTAPLLRWLTERLARYRDQL